MKILLPLVLVSLFLVTLVGAQKPNEWHGLILDESTPEDAVKTFGKAAKDQENQQLRVFSPANHWLSKKQKDKVFRLMVYDLGKKEGVQKVHLYFLDGKLVKILLDLKAGEISPNGLGNIYGVQMSPMVGAMDLAMNPQDFERNQGRIYPKSFPTVYYLVGVSEKSIVSGMIGNSSFGSVLGRTMGVPDAPGNFPGKVEYIELISRSLENRDGTNILK